MDTESPGTHLKGLPAEAPDFQLLFNALPGALLVLLPDEPVFTIVAANQAALTLCDSGNSLVQTAVFDALPANPEDSEKLRASLSRVLHNGNPDRIELRRGLGNQAWNILSSPLIGAEGGILNIVLSMDKAPFPESVAKAQLRTFEIALAHTPDFTYVFDLDGRFTYVNQALLSLWQRTLEDAIGKNFFDLQYPPDLAERLQKQIQEVIRTKQPLRDQTPFTGPTGVTGNYEYIFVPVFDATGRVEAVVGSTRDITDRIHSETLIREDRQRWLDLLRQAPAAIAVLREPLHRFEWANTAYLNLIGRSAEEIAGKTLQEALPELAGQMYIGLLDSVYKTGEPFFGHESPVLLHRDGAVEEVFVNFVYLANKTSTGEIDGVFVHVMDVTDMVRARRQIEESERQFRTLAESIPNLVWMADATGNIFWYNRRWYDYTGTTLEQMEGWGWQAVHDPKILPGVMDAWTNALKTGEPFEMIFPLRRHDGFFGSFLTRVEPLRDSDGQIVRWFGTNTDITGQRNIEEELRRANRELEEFAYVASHDLQEPLRMVNIYTELIVNRCGDGDPALKQYSEFVRRGVSRMEMLIRDLLTFSRTVQKEEQPVGEADLSASLAEAKSVLSTRIEETRATITCAEPLPQVKGETSQLVHVFENLLSNSLKYRKKTEAPVICISALAEGDNWIVSLSDNGIGFEPRFSDRIFGLFKRLHGNEYAGTGLGLAICQRIIERYGGRIWADGRPGDGATFHFALPRTGL